MFVKIADFLYLFDFLKSLNIFNKSSQKLNINC